MKFFFKTHTFIILALLLFMGTANATSTITTRSATVLTQQPSPANTTIGTVLPATINSGDVIVLSILGIQTSAYTVTCPAGFTHECATVRTSNQQIDSCVKIAAGTEGGTTVNSTSSLTLLSWNTYGTALYDPNGGTLSVYGSQCGTGSSANPVTPNNTTHNWDAVYGEVEDVVSGYSIVESSQYRVLGAFPPPTNPTDQAFLTITPALGAPSTLTYVASGANWLWNYIFITGANAPSPDYRLRSTSSNQGTTGGTLAVTAPVGIANGDLLIGVCSNDTTTAITCPTGFTRFLSATTTQALAGCSKTAASESGSYTFTFGGTPSISNCSVDDYYDVGGGTLLVESNSVSTNVASATSITPSALTPNNANDLLGSYVFAQLSQANGPLNPVGWIMSKWFNGGAGTLMLQSSAFNVAGTTSSVTPPVVKSNSGTSTKWVALTLDMTENNPTPTPTATATPTATPTATATPVSTAVPCAYAVCPKWYPYCCSGHSAFPGQ